MIIHVYETSFLSFMLQVSIAYIYNEAKGALFKI